MAIAIGTNHRPRKTLADQIDRLDTVLDALSDGLNESVRDVVANVVERVVHEAVRAAVTEVLANVELQRRLATPTKADPKPIQRAWHGLTGLTTRCWNWMVGALRSTGRIVTSSTAAVREHTHAGVKETAQRIKRATTGAWLWLHMLTCLAVRLRRPLVAAIGVGLAVSASSYVSGLAVASLVSGMAVSLLTLTGLALRRWQMFALHFQPTNS